MFGGCDGLELWIYNFADVGWLSFSESAWEIIVQSGLEGWELVIENNILCVQHIRRVRRQELKSLCKLVVDEDGLPDETHEVIGFGGAGAMQRPAFSV